jgi:hypothetical protein
VRWLGVLGVAVAAAAAPPPLRAQGFWEQFTYEGLRLSGIGVEGGGLIGDRVQAAPSIGVRVEYGRVAPRVAIVLGFSYMRSDFHASEVTEFERRLRGVVDDPTDDFTIDVGTITWSDYRAGLDFRYIFTEQRVRPYVAVGLGIHVWDGDGAAIQGTFVEDALDTIAAGVAGAVGILAGVSRNLDFTAELRGEVTSELRTVRAHAGFMLYFPHSGAR